MSVIYADKVAYEAGKRLIINDITLSVRARAFVCIMGPNGAGKSTLIKLLCGLLKPLSGSIYINGRKQESFGKKEYASEIAYVPQFNTTEIHFSVEEYILTGRYPYQKPLSSASQKDKEIVENVLEATSLGYMRSREVNTLSGGERQRVLLASALAQQTDILLLDEPTMHLDPKSAADILELLAKINTEGATVIMVNHDINQALTYCTDFVGVKDGKVLFEYNSADELIKSGVVDELFDFHFNKVANNGVWQLLPAGRSMR